MEFDEMLNLAVRTSIKASYGTERTQINQLLEKLESEPGYRGVAITIIHILKQKNRGHIREDLAKDLVKNLKKILDENQIEAKLNARKYLGLLKWLYDGVKDLGIKEGDLKKGSEFISLLNKYIGGH